MPTAPKPLAVYGPKAMKEEGEEVANIDKLEEAKKREERERERKARKAKEAKPKASDFKPSTNLAKGGTASKRADGCAMRGKTRGKIV